MQIFKAGSHVKQGTKLCYPTMEVGDVTTPVCRVRKRRKKEGGWGRSLEIQLTISTVSLMLLSLWLSTPRRATEVEVETLEPPV